MGLFVAVSSTTPAADQQQSSTSTSGHCRQLSMISRPLLLLLLLLVYIVAVGCLLQQQHHQVAGSSIRDGGPQAEPAKRLDMGDGFEESEFEASNKWPLHPPESYKGTEVDMKFEALQAVLDQDCGRVPLLTNLDLWPGTGGCERPTIKPTPVPEWRPKGRQTTTAGPTTTPSGRKKEKKRREKRFVNSKTVDYGLFPSLVEVRSGFYTPSGSTYWTNLCNGVIVGKREVITEVACIRNRKDSENEPLVAINTYRTPDNRQDRKPPRPIFLRFAKKICVSEKWRKSYKDGYRYPDDRFAVLHFDEDFQWDDYTQSACLPWGKYYWYQYRDAYMASYGLDGNFKVQKTELDGEHTMRMVSMGKLHLCHDILKPPRPSIKFFTNYTTLRCTFVDHSVPPGWGYFCNDGVVSDAGAPLLTPVRGRLVVQAFAVSSKYPLKTPDCNPDVGDIQQKVGPTVVNSMWESMEKGDLYQALTCNRSNFY